MLLFFPPFGKIMIITELMFIADNVFQNFFHSFPAEEL